MKKYDVIFCNCGTVHFLNSSIYDEVLFDDVGKLNGKEIIHTCLNCGSTMIRGLDDCGCNEEGENEFCHYSKDMKETMENIDSDKYYIILSKGIRLRMESGGYANGFRGKLYIDEDSLVKEIGNSDLCNIKEVSHSSSAKYDLREIKSVNVDMQNLLKEITDEQAESLSGYVLESFNWIDTKYKKEYHS